MSDVQWRFPEETDSGWPSRWHASVLHDTLSGGVLCFPTSAEADIQGEQKL